MIFDILHHVVFKNVKVNPQFFRKFPHQEKIDDVFAMLLFNFYPFVNFVFEYQFPKIN